MTSSNPTAHGRWLGSMAAAALAFAGTSIALASDSTKTDGGAHETVIVKIIKDDGHGAGARHGREIAIADACDSAKPQIDMSDETKGDKGEARHSRIMICNHAGRNQGDMLAALEKARADIAGISELSESAKAKALASLDEEISRLKEHQGYSKQ